MRLVLHFLTFVFAALLPWQALAEISQPISGSLANGLRYTILPLHQEKNHLEIRMRVNAGSVDETDAQTGVAHMVEHLVFRASSAHPQGVMDFLHSRNWVRAKNYNAVTTYDNTTYLLTPPATASLPQAFEVLDQMLFHAKLSQPDLDKERQIILEEWRSGQGVGSRMNAQRTASVRGYSRYARSPVIGTQQSIETMPASQLQDFYHRWYAPNNMHLLIVGDVQPKEVETLIEQTFGKEARKTLPTRDYYEPQLAARLTINQLQDKQSGVSQIAYIWRFDESESREQTEEGRYQRLVDRLALAHINQRLRNQQSQLPKGVNSVVVRKSDIGKTSVALGIFSSTAPTSQQAGLAQIFNEIERLKRYPISEEELAEQKKVIQAQIDYAKQNDESRDFAGWMQTMVNTLLVDKPYLPQKQIAALTEPMLHKVTAQAVQQRLLQWFAAPDRIVQYQAPRLTQIEPITQARVEALQQQAEKAEIAAPQPAKSVETMFFAPLEKQGEINKTQDFAAQNVTHWQLSNGDKVVWLKLPLAKDRSYFVAQNSAGFNAAELNRWQSQLAAQMIAQNAPNAWEIEQLSQWKKDHAVNLSIEQNATELSFKGSTDNAHLADLLRLYYAYQTETQVREGLDEAKESIARQIDLQNEKSQDVERLNAISLLRFGKTDETSLPNKRELEALGEQDLDQQWQKMVSAPTTFFLVSNLPQAEMETLVRRYLAELPRGKRFVSAPVLQTAGSNTASFAMNVEPKNDVRLWSFTPHQWQGKDAVLVSLLRQIASQKLKLALRDQMLGIYSLRFETTLNAQDQRIESELSFTAKPEMTEKLIAQAQQVLKDLPNQLQQADIDAARSQFIQQETERLKSPETWLHRLILSENQFGTPLYLSQMETLANEIQLDKLKQIAAEIYSPENHKIFITTQQK